MESLPFYSDEFLASLGPEALIELMERDEDRVPRAVIDACARHGDAMTAELGRVLARAWTDREADGPSWLRLHAAMILGLLPTEDAGLLLVSHMRRMSEEGDENLQDWLAGSWPAFFSNKPDAVRPALEAIWADRELDWYIRSNALDPIVASAQRAGGMELDRVLAGLARLAADERTDWDIRMSCAMMLIDFPREAHRGLLERLADQQGELALHFSRQEVDDAYAAGKDDPEWLRFDDPWKFYLPEEIAARQQRWAREAAEDDEEFVSEFLGGGAGSTYLRIDPKVGRNDPCPCGSGAKYKKCCLPKGLFG